MTGTQVVRALTLIRDLVEDLLALRNSTRYVETVVMLGSIMNWSACSKLQEAKRESGIAEKEIKGRGLSHNIMSSSSPYAIV